MLDRLPLSDLRALIGSFRDQIESADPDREPQFVNYLKHSLEYARAEIDRRAGAIPSDRRRADNLRAVVASTLGRLEEWAHDAQTDGMPFKTNPHGEAVIARLAGTLQLALADDDREREKLK